MLHDDSSWRSTIKISPEGNRVAYLVRSPNLAANHNEIELYVRNLPADLTHSGKPVLVGDISALQWLADGRHLTILMKKNGRRVIEQVDSVTGDVQIIFKADDDIAEYSTDRAANTLVYATDVSNKNLMNGPTTQEMASGYRIPFQAPGQSSWLRRRVFFTRRIEGAWTAPKPILVRSPLTEQPLTALAHSSGNSGLSPSLSPDGTALLLSYFDLSEKMPEEWSNSRYMKFRNSAGVIQAFNLLVLYNIVTGETTVPLKTPRTHSAPLWAADSKSFVVVAQAPVGSELEQEAFDNHRIGHSSGAHLFWVEPSSGKIQLVASRLAYPWEGPLYWEEGGDLLVRASTMNTVTHFSHKDDEWREGVSFQVPIQLGDQVATDGKYLVGEFNDTQTPPQLFVYQRGREQVKIFAKLNPQFEGLTLAHSREIHWKTSAGFDASGLLLVPPDYIKDVKYPLVVQTKPFGRLFVCAFGNFPSFAPQPLANAGIMYLGPISTRDSKQRKEDYLPAGYPGYQGAGGVAEAAFEMDVWESAVKTLDAQGLIDRNKVGIIGYSRTGWYTEFILAHSKFRYRAATVADNVQYSLGEYWLSHDAGAIKEYELTYGGAPYGATLKNWLDYSVSFNIDKIHTPLLMEEMGYGTPYNSINAPPLSLAASFEVFTGLNRLNKPVELYYYPNEEHEPDHPQARLATLQRNVDWYRFWLQGFERSHPQDPDQYLRWHRLQRLQQADDRKAGLSPAISGSEPGNSKQ